MKDKSIGLLELQETITTLRGKNGCPWDKKQTKETLTKYIKEEMTELLEAIETGSPNHICEESGDVLFLLIMLAEIHSEELLYTFEDVIVGINNKLIRRHPHVFGESTISNEEELKKQWNEIKANEKSLKK